MIDKIRIIELLCGLFAVSQLFVLGACAVMNGTRRSSKPWFFATAMLHWSALCGISFVVAIATMILFGAHR